MRARRGLIVLLMAAATFAVAAGPAPLPVPASKPPSFDPSPYTEEPLAAAEYLYGIPEGLDLERLVGKTTVIGSASYPFVDPATGEKRLGGYVDVVGLYDVPMPALLDCLLDFAHYPDFVPYILESDLDDVVDGTYKAHYRVGMSILGISLVYETWMETRVDQLPGNAVGVRSWLVKNPDGSLYESYNSFYLVPVTVQGKPMVFIRYFNRPGLRKPALGMQELSKTFTAMGGKSQVNAMVDEARKRLKKK